MHTTIQQQSNHSSKSVNGTTATSPLKYSPDSMQNSSTCPSQPKRKKRDRGDHKSESTKRERIMKHHNGDIGETRSESPLKSELAKLTEEGGLVDSESVERLVQLMQPDKSQGKIDLGCRSMIAGILAATDKFDCLNQFVQLRGFLMLDEWLQEVHKSKTSDSGALKDSDKSVDDFLLILLRALEKLPINLEVLKCCNIGKSVNHLRSNKNSEIQRKSRSLVDTWKKRVEAEMNNDESKSASSQAVPWTGRSRLEVSHGGNKHSSLSSTSATKSSGHVASSKSASVKHSHGETALKASSVSSGPQKSSSPPSSTAANVREGQIKTPAVSGYSEPPQTTVKEERSTSSSQSHTNSQCSSDLPAHVRNPVPSSKEDARSSTARSKSINKSNGTSRSRKSANNIHGTSSAIQKDSGSGQISTVTRDSDSEKVSHCNIAAENASAAAAGVVETSHKIIVKISNRGRSPGHGVHTGSAEEVSCKNSRASSPDHSEKHDHSDSSLRNKSIACHIGETDVSPSDVKQSGTSMDSVKRLCVSKVTHSPSGKETRSPLLDSLSPMNALVESCVKHSEGLASSPACDEAGMNLLASVAAEEVCKPGSASPAVSPLTNTINAGNPNTECQGSGSASVNGGGSIKSSEDLLQKEEPSLKTVGKLDEPGGDVSVPVSSISIMDKSASGVDEQTQVSVSFGKDESQDPVTDTIQIARTLPAEDVVKVEASIEGVGKDSDSSVKHVSSRHDDQIKKSNQELSSNAVTLPDQPPLTSSNHTNTNKGQVLESCGTELPLAPETSSYQKADDANMGNKGCSKLVDACENQKTNLNADSLSAPVKEEADTEQKTMSRDASPVKNNVGLHSAAPISRDLYSGGGVKPVSPMNSASALVENKDESASSAADTSVSASVVSLTDKKHEFDLNEGFNLEDVKNGEQISFATLPFSTPASLVRVSHSASVSFPSGHLPTAVTVTAAAKGPFVPPEDLLRNKTELGWKGSAATSAFRPAEPRKVIEPSTGTQSLPLHDGMSPKQVRPILDFDLNVTDEQILQDTECQNSFEEINLKNDGQNSRNLNCASKGSSSLRSSVGLELDLNRVDDAQDMVQPSTKQGQDFEASGQSVKLPCEPSTKRDFDLNDGPLEEAAIEPLAYSQSNISIIPPQPSFRPRMNSPMLGNLSQWCPPGASYSAVTIPSLLPDNRGDQPLLMTGAGGPQRILSVPAGSTSINPDFYRGSLIPSSPALPFGTTAFQYPAFPFGTSFPLSTSFLPGGSGAFVDPSSGARYCAPAIPTQLAGIGGAVPSQFFRPGVANLPSVSSSSSLVGSSGKWNNQDLDLNSGPGGGDVEKRDEVLHMTSRQLPPQVLTEEQSRIYQVASGGSKRKEPEGGWKQWG